MDASINMFDNFDQYNQYYHVKIPIRCIVAVGKDHGISTQDSNIPWYIPADLEHFKRHTVGNVVIMGSKTFFSLPDTYRPLPNRLNVVITKTPDDDKFKEYHSHGNVSIFTFPEFMKFMEQLDHLKEQRKYYVIGGESIYNLFKPYIKYIHLTHVMHPDNPFVFNKFFFKIPCNYSINNYSELCNYNQYSFRFIDYVKGESHQQSSDHVYLRLCNQVLKHGEKRIDRTGTGTLSIFGEQMKFDISQSIPILTTKRVPWKSCIEELLWFLRGNTNSKDLDHKGVKIWNGNSSREFLDQCGLNHLEDGDCGANYSFQWRHFGASYVDCHTDYSHQGTDQIAYIETLLKEEPTSRRIFLSAWNPCDLDKTVLPPCHVSCQFYVDNNNGLSCHLYQRSCDMFLGVPWNILSYSILTYILAFRNGFSPKSLTISTGDTHVYLNHLEQIKTQSVREPLAYPKLLLRPSIKEKSIEDISVDDFEMIGYFPHPTIKGTMSV